MARKKRKARMIRLASHKVVVPSCTIILSEKKGLKRTTFTIVLEGRLHSDEDEIKVI